jgi:hypothetical protein
VAIRVPPIEILDALRAALQAIGTAADGECSKASEAAQGISPETVYPTGVDVAAIQERFAAALLVFAREWLHAERPDARMLQRAQARAALEVNAAALIEQCVPGIIERVLPSGYRHILHSRLRWLREEMRLALEGEIEALLIGYAAPNPADPGTPQQRSETEQPQGPSSPEAMPRGMMPRRQRHSQSTPDTKATARIEAFQEAVMGATGCPISKLDIALVTGYKDDTWIMRFQREDSDCTQKQREKFDHTLRMTPSDFVAALARIKTKK